MNVLLQYITFILIFSGLFCLPPVQAAEGDGAAFYDIGVFSYESGDYVSAEHQIGLAVEAEPDNPYYRHSLGRVFLKKGDYDQALIHLEKAVAVDPAITGLKFDLATAYYKLNQYEKAAPLFSEAADADPEDALARYQAGMSLYTLERYHEAADQLTRVQNSPTLLPPSRYITGLCYFKTDRPKAALEMFTRVTDDPEAGDLKIKAQKWINAIRDQEKADKPWGVYGKLGFRYDDNVRLDPIDLDLEGDESDTAMVFNFLGSYRFFKSDQFSAGAEYLHYTSIYNDLDDYNLTGSMLKAYADYLNGPFTMKLSVLPSYYWLDSESYLRRWEIRPEAFWQATDKITARITGRYINDKNMMDDGKSGDLGGFFLGGRMRIPEISSTVFGGAGWENLNAHRDDESWKELKATAGITVDLPMEIVFTASGMVNDRRYDALPGVDFEKRKDRKWTGSLSVSRPVVYDWLYVVGEYVFTKRESNYVNKQYERNKVTLSLAVWY